MSLKKAVQKELIKKAKAKLKSMYENNDDTQTFLNVFNSGIFVDLKKFRQAAYKLSAIALDRVERQINRQ